MRLSMTISITLLLLSVGLFETGCASRTKILNDGERAFLVQASKSQVKILQETETGQKVEVADPSFLDGAYVFLPGQVHRIGDALADCHQLPLEASPTPSPVAVPK